MSKTLRYQVVRTLLGPGAGHADAELFKAERALLAAAFKIQEHPEVLINDEVRGIFERIKRDGKYLAARLYPPNSAGARDWDENGRVRRPRSQP